MARDLQKEFHPDKSSSQEEFKEKMEKYSSYINEAKATLLNDLQRAIYLMELKGVEVTEDIEVGGGPFMEELF
jgi:DnaJ-domain-containing protein 1